MAEDKKHAPPPERNPDPGDPRPGGVSQPTRVQEGNDDFARKIQIEVPPAKPNDRPDSGE